ncbi:T3SS effector HopA1 family protein [Acrocarpospora sp. B8E8]
MMLRQTPDGPVEFPMRYAPILLNPEESTTTSSDEEPLLTLKPSRQPVLNTTPSPALTPSKKLPVQLPNTPMVSKKPAPQIPSTSDNLSRLGIGPTESSPAIRERKLRREKVQRFEESDVSGPERPSRLTTREEGGPSQRTRSPSGRSQRLALTKRRGNRPEDMDRQDETRYRLNAARDMAFVQALYNDLFVEGILATDMRTVQQDIYRRLGFSALGYLDKAITEAEIFQLFAGAGPGTYNVVNQLMALAGTDIREALKIGDYVSFSNARYPGFRATQEQRQRRLLVNVANQRASIKIVQGLLPLFNDKSVERYFKEVKVFLSTVALPLEDVKNDKLVVYYDVGPVQEDTSDYVGDQLATMIYAMIEPGDVDETITPFYSELMPAVSWAEDALDFAPEFAGLSFTQSRAMAIATALRFADDRWDKTGQTVKSAEELMTLIQMAFMVHGIHPTMPHRHKPSTTS